jgi:phospholipase C
MIGQTDQANHQYDLADFWNAVVCGTLPAVRFLKFSSANTGHPNDSTALAEQRYVVDTVNALQQLPQWKSMAILITYDDSDGWYDHVDAADRQPVQRSGERFVVRGQRALRNTRAQRLPRPLRVRTERACRSR